MTFKRMHIDIMLKELPTLHTLCGANVTMLGITEDACLKQQPETQEDFLIS